MMGQLQSMYVTPDGLLYFKAKEQRLKDGSGVGPTYVIVYGDNVQNNFYDSTITIDQSINNIYNMIDQKSDNGNELKELVAEIKDYIDTMEKRKEFSRDEKLSKKMMKHLNDNKWLYEPLVSLFGKAMIKMLGL